MLELYNFTFTSEEELALETWLAECAQRLRGLPLGRIQYVALSKDEMQAMNLRLLNHDYCTDVITIPYDYDCPSYEAYVCPDFIYDNAREWGLEAKEEWFRVLVHALLHMIGFNDSDDSARAEMRAAEEKCLILRPKLLKDNI